MSFFIVFSFIVFSFIVVSFIEGSTQSMTARIETTSGPFAWLRPIRRRCGASAYTWDNQALVMAFFPRSSILGSTSTVLLSGGEARRGIHGKWIPCSWLSGDYTIKSE
ncbi:hypothetical protein IIE18_11470 [Pseudomonas sp. V1]|uniref:hypothetical protein n=1 Tax=Pseudomonas arcuscaelestis TaxID=2710591 RepID=UPI00193F83B3|nr:hypothetical protein [Pseudomonas arcuscaelestis]MBM3105760.1 hypothetical protein [Pseudomonas arcuscaelestis]